MANATIRRIVEARMYTSQGCRRFYYESGICEKSDMIDLKQADAVKAGPSEKDNK